MLALCALFIAYDRLSDEISRENLMDTQQKTKKAQQILHQDVFSPQFSTELSIQFHQAIDLSAFEKLLDQCMLEKGRAPDIPWWSS